MKEIAQPNISLINGVACFQEVIAAAQPIGSREVARRVGMNHTKVNRLLGTLRMLGLVTQTAERKYGPGNGLHILGAQALRASGLLQTALPHLMQLHAEGLTVALGVVWRGQVCYLFNERPGQHLERSIGTHPVYPAECSSLGMALLAAQAGPVERPPFDPEDPSFKTLLPNQDFDSSIAAAREAGYAVRRYKDNVASVGVTIGSPPIAAIAVSRNYLAEAFIPVLAARLKEVASRITAELGEKRLIEAGGKPLGT